MQSCRSGSHIAYYNHIHRATDRRTIKMSTNTEEELIPKKGATSVVWKWFGYKRSDIEQTTVLCKVCRKTIAAKHGNTTNLFQQLRQRHAVEWQECVALRDADASSSHKAPAKKQVTLAAAFSTVIPYDKKGPRWQAITDAVTYYIAKDMVPIYTVEKNGFIKMLQTIDPKYQLPSRKYFVALPNLYNKTRARVAEQLQNIVYYSTTTDLWSSRTTHPYLSLTVHFIDGEWALRGMCLQTSYFPDDHTGEIIAQGLQDSLASWKLREDSLVCMTTDSGSNMIKALRLTEWPNLQCFGHRLHNAISKWLHNA